MSTTMSFSPSLPMCLLLCVSNYVSAHRLSLCPPRVSPCVSYCVSLTVSPSPCLSARGAPEGAAEAAMVAVVVSLTAVVVSRWVRGALPNGVAGVAARVKQRLKVHTSP